MATRSDVVLTSAHTTGIHGIYSLENTNVLGHSSSISANSCIDATKNIPVRCSEHSDSFQNLFGIDGYLRSHQNKYNNSVYHNNNTDSDCKKSNIALEYFPRINICLLCEEENKMNNNIKTCNHICKGQEVSQEVNDAQHIHEVGNLSSENDGSDDKDSDIHSKNLSNLEKHYEALHVECQTTECLIYDHNDFGNQEINQEKLRPFSLSGEDQMSLKQKVFGGGIALLGFSSGTKMEYSNSYSQSQFPKLNDDSKNNDLTDHPELPSLILNRNRGGLQKEYTSGPNEKMADSGDVFKLYDKEVKENSFHPVDTAIEKMTLHKAQEITSFDSCTCINPGSSHACVTRAPTYGILNPLFDDSLRNIFLQRNADFDKRRSLKIPEKPSSSSFEPMNLLLPPLANAPNTQGSFYYLPHCLPSISNPLMNSKQNSIDSIVSMSSEKVERYEVPSSSQSAYTNHDTPLTQMSRNERTKHDLNQRHLPNSRKEFTSKPKYNETRVSSIAEKPSSFLSAASGEITLPYSPPDIQEELMFPDTSYGKGTEIIQNLNAHEKDFILGRPTRTPRANDIFDLTKREAENYPELRGNEHRTKNIEKKSLTGQKPPVRETCMTGVTSVKPKITTLERDVAKSKGVSRPRKLEVNNSSDTPKICQANKHGLLDKTHSVPIDIPLKLVNFDRDDYVSYKNETHAPEKDIPHCLRLNCLDPCKEGVCLNSVGKSFSFTNFTELSEQAIDTESKIVHVNESQRRSSDSFVPNPSNLGKYHLGGKLKGPCISLNEKGGQPNKIDNQAAGKKKSLSTQQRSILREDIDQDTASRDNQPKIVQDKIKPKYSDSKNSSRDQCKNSEQRAPIDDGLSRIGKKECHGINYGVPPRKSDPNKQTRLLSKGPDVPENSIPKPDIEVKDYRQSSFSSDDGASHSAGSASQESSDNSNDSRKSLSLLDRRRNAAKRKDQLKLKIADHSSSEKVGEIYELGEHFRRNEDMAQVEIIESNKIQSDSLTSQTEDHLLTSLVDDLTNYWLDSPSPNSLAPYPFLESPGDFSSKTDMHSTTKYPETSGFSRKSDFTCSTETSTKSETKYRKRIRAVATKSAPTVFENPVSMANCSPDSDKTLTREIVRNIIEEKRSRSKSNSASSPSDIQIDTTHPTRESQRHRKRGTQHSPDADTSVPYEPLVTPSPMTPCGGFLEGSTPLLPGESGKSFSSSVDRTNHGLGEDSALFNTADFDKSIDGRITPQWSGCLESSGAISKRSSIPKASDHPKRLHNRRHDSHRHSLPHNHKRPPPSSSSSDDATSSDSSSSDSSSSSGSSSSTSESSSDLEDIVHLRP